MTVAEVRNRIGEAVVRSRPADPPQHEIATALFNEHLDLAAIRKALGQPRAAPRPASDPGDDDPLPGIASAAVEEGDREAATVHPPAAARRKSRALPVALAAAANWRLRPH